MAEQQPNILFFLTDQHRHDWLGTDPSVPVRTPTIDALADRGVRFPNAVCPSPLCGPSRAALASGMEYDRAGVFDHQENYPTDQPTYYGRLRDEAGYHVMGCGKFDLHKPDFSWGVDGQNRVAEWGFSDAVDSAGKWATVGSWEEHDGPNDPYMAYLDSEGLAQRHLEDYRRRRGWNPFTETYPTPLPEHAYVDNWVPQVGLDLLDRAPADQPWHLVVNFSGPHDPMDVTESMHTWYRHPDIEFPPPTAADGEYDPETHQEIRRNYAAMIENVDGWLQRYLDRLEQRGELEETLIVYASDHGEMLGDYGRWRKKVPYRPSIGIPMVVAGPGVAGGRVLDTPVSLIDLHDTFLAYAGHGPTETDSRSLEPILAGEADPTSHRNAVYTGLGAWRAAFDGRFERIEGYRPIDDADDYAAEHDPEADPILLDTVSDGRENVIEAYPHVADRLQETIESNRKPQALRNRYTE